MKNQTIKLQINLVFKLVIKAILTVTLLVSSNVVPAAKFLDKTTQFMALLLVTLVLSMQSSAAQTGESSEYNDYTFEPVTARHVRVLQTGTFDIWWAGKA